MKLKAKFQDEDFDLGEVVEVLDIAYGADGTILLKADAKRGGRTTFAYKTLAEFNEEWEDYEEESKIYYVIFETGDIKWFYHGDFPEIEKLEKQFGNYFETKEEAEKAVEKLKAITRLNKCGFKFEGYADRDRAKGGDIVIYAHVDIPNNNLLEEAQPAMLKDLDLLFGGEE